MLLLRSEISFAACQKIRKYRKGSLDYTLELILLDPSEVNVKNHIPKKILIPMVTGQQKTNPKGCLLILDNNHKI